MSPTNAQTERYVFLDRDGVINVERGDYTTTIEEWEWAPRALEGIQLFTDAGFKIIVITNQACIAKGRQTEEGLAVLHDYMLCTIRESGGDILRIYHCPHQTSDGCSCRKPEPGLLLRAADDYGIDLKHTFFIGDASRDMEAAARAGVRGILIDTGLALGEKRFEDTAAEFRADDLVEAARIVLRKSIIAE